MNGMFSLAADDDTDEDPVMKAWFGQPVAYMGITVTRSTAFALCADEHRDWRFLDHVTNLPPIEGVDREDCYTAAEAQTWLADRYDGRFTKNIGRDF